MRNIVKQIENIYPNDETCARMIVSMVQNIPYDNERSDCILNMCPESKDWYYPYETLYKNTGVCADKSILMAYMLHEIGYKVVLFEFESDEVGHMAVGVACDSNYDFMDTGYAYIESTMPTIMTYDPEIYGSYGDYEFKIVKISNYGKLMNLQEEYHDAKRLKEIEEIWRNNNNVLDGDIYYDWETICNAYGLDI
jgi:hypothetical protein